MTQLSWAQPRHPTRPTEKEKRGEREVRAAATRWLEIDFNISRPPRVTDKKSGKKRGVSWEREVCPGLLREILSAAAAWLSDPKIQILGLLPRLVITRQRKTDSGLYRMMLATRFLCVAVLAAVASAENFTWLGLSVDTTASSEPPARHSAAMGSWNNQFYVFGGIGNVHNGSRLFGEEMYYCSCESCSCLL